MQFEDGRNLPAFDESKSLVATGYSNESSYPSFDEGVLDSQGFREGLEFRSILRRKITGDWTNFEEL